MQDANWKEKWSAADAVRFLYGESQKRTNGKTVKSLGMMADAGMCLAKYGATFHDYMSLRFYLRDAQSRATFLTTQLVKKEKAKWPKDAVDGIDNKGSFNAIFSDYAGREWVDVDKSSLEDFAGFVRRQGDFFIKPKRESSGIGIKRFNIQELDEDDIARLFVESKGCLAEEVMIAHKDLQELNPDSMSFVRVVTVFGAKGPHILAATLRTGGKKDVSFNTAKDDIFVQVDIDTGVCFTDGVDESGGEHVVHPVSGIRLKGFTIPEWRAVLDACTLSAKRVSEVKVIGWDVAILDNGVAFFEGNPGSGVASMQIADGIGKKHLFYEYLND